jgi:hypothetical protein
MGLNRLRPLLRNLVAKESVTCLGLVASVNFGARYPTASAIFAGLPCRMLLCAV